MSAESLRLVRLARWLLMGVAGQIPDVDAAQGMLRAVEVLEIAREWEAEAAPRAAQTSRGGG